jgi:heat shock protein HslJ
MKKVLLFLLLASLLLSACTSQERSLQGSWSLTAYGPPGAAIPAAPDSQASITFNEDGTVSGSSGCNGFGGEYSVEGDQVKFSGLVSTLMACEEPLMSQEGTVFKVLNDTASYTIDGDMLTITKDGMALVFTAAEAGSTPK